MKIRNLILSAIVILHFSTSAPAQTFTDTITKTMGFEKKHDGNAVVVTNVNGHVTVTGYSGDQVVVEVKRTITAKTQERLETGKRELQLGVIDRADTLLLFVNDGCHQFGRKGSDNRKGRNPDHRTLYGYLWSENQCETLYDYRLDFTVKVPAQINVLVSTVNNGDVTVAGVNGAITANNVNGSIKLSDLARETQATTINGNVDVVFLKNPGKACRFYSLNGTINAQFQKGLAADMSFNSFNGNLFTNLDLEKLPAVVSKEERGSMMKYKIKENRFRTGSGGALLDFETLNGNVYIKE